MTPEVLDILKRLTPEQVRYLANLVDQDTTGNQDDSLYLLLIAAFNAYDDVSEQE